MSFSRRDFLKRFAVATAAATAATVAGGVISEETIDRLLWTPGEKTIIDLGARKTIIDPTKEVRLATDEQIADLVASKSEEFRCIIEAGGHPGDFRRAGALVRNQRLSIVSGGEIGHFHLVDGRLQGGPKEAEQFRRLDRPWNSTYHDATVRKGPFYDVQLDQSYPDRRAWIEGHLKLTDKD